MRNLSPKENLLRVLNRNEPQYVPVRRMDGRLDGLVNLFHEGCLPPSNGKDNWGITWAGGLPARSEWEPEILSYPITHPLEDISDIDAYLFPDPSKSKIMDRLLDDIDKEKVMISGRLQFLLLERASLLLGMEKLMIAMLDEPNRASILLRKIADYQIVIIHHYLEYGVNIIRATDDYGGQNKMLLSPHLWRKLIKPELARIIKYVKDGGAMFQLHSCGHIMEIIPDLMEIGVDILDPIQARANNLPEMKRLYGNRLSFWGGVDTQELLTLGNPNEVTIQVKKTISFMAPGGGYVLGPDNLITIPKANYQAYLSAGERFGKYPLQL